MKPTREQVTQWGLLVFDEHPEDKGHVISPSGYNWIDDKLAEFAALAYQAGAEKGKEAYEREHLRHTVPLPDALRVMQNQVAEACAKACDDLADCEENTDAYRAGAHWCRDIIRSGEWRKYMDGK